MASNPYQPPTHDHSPPEPHPDHPEGWVPCPRCKGTHLNMPGFTWWGGALGQKLLNHVKCQSCGTAFNAKTGKSNTPAIVLYQLIVVSVLLGLFYALDLF